MTHPAVENAQAAPNAHAGPAHSQSRPTQMLEAMSPAAFAAARSPSP